MHLSNIMVVLTVIVRMKYCFCLQERNTLMLLWGAADVILWFHLHLDSCCVTEFKQFVCNMP